MSMCRVISCVIGKGCLFLPVHSFGKTLLDFALLHFVLQGLTCLLLWVSLDFLLLHSNPQGSKGHLILCVCVCVLDSVLCLRRISQLQFLQHQWLGYRLEDYYNVEWFVLETTLRSFCRFCGCTQVLHFRLFC